ncbi:MAG: hypothetical protein J1G02_03655 [Clostridiales bacterium]|nr:hypothetical protein [Clostridiales bacterium]
MNSKVETYIGFAIKKGSVVLGCDSIKSNKKHLHLLLYTPTLSDNSLSVLQNVSQRTGCPIAQIDDYETLKKKNCKALAICDKSLANAILENLM